jgi:hypothetical protein
VPAFYAHGGDDIIGKPEGYGRQRRDEYTANDYHKVSDEIKPWWDLRGAAQDADLLFQIGQDLAKTDSWPGMETRLRVQGPQGRDDGGGLPLTPPGPYPPPKIMTWKPWRLAALLGPLALLAGCGRRGRRPGRRLPGRLRHPPGRSFGTAIPRSPRTWTRRS